MSELLDWRQQLDQVLADHPGLEDDLLRLWRVNVLGTNYPFPLREKFFDKYFTHLLMIRPHADWVKLSSSATMEKIGSLDGAWKSDDEVICVKDGSAHWMSRCVDEPPCAIRKLTDSSYQMQLCGSTYHATYTPDGQRMVWDDGDIWYRLSDYEMGLFTNGQTTHSMCVLLCSVCSFRYQNMSILERELTYRRQQLEDIKSGASHSTGKGEWEGKREWQQAITPYVTRVTTCFEILLGIVPVDVQLRDEFKQMASCVQRLVAEQRAQYTPDSVRAQFQVLLVGHSYLHLERRRRHGSTGEVLDFLRQREWFTASLDEKPLCNDIAQLHRDDLHENLFSLPRSDLSGMLPMDHFAAIVLVHCPATLTPHAFHNFASLLRPGGLLVAVPTNMNSQNYVPSDLQEKAMFDRDSEGHWAEVKEMGPSCRKPCKAWMKQDSSDASLESASKRARIDRSTGDEQKC